MVFGSEAGGKAARGRHQVARCVKRRQLNTERLEVSIDKLVRVKAVAEVKLRAKIAILNKHHINEVETLRL